MIVYMLTYDEFLQQSSIIMVAFDLSRKVDLSRCRMNLSNFNLGGKYLIFDAVSRDSNSVTYYGAEKQTMEERLFKFYDFREIEERTNFTHKEIIKRSSKIQRNVLSQCRSKHVLSCLDVYEDRDHRVEVYEFCPISLQEEIEGRKNKSISEIRALLILRQILLGLKSFHEGPKLIHTALEPRDIKIKNGIYKIAHSGFPSPDEDETVSRLAAPQILKRTFYDSKAEVWNIGILFHQILFGELPSVYRKEGKVHIELQSALSIYQLGQQDDKSVSKETKQFLWKCLIPDVDKRMSWPEMESHPMFSLLGAANQEQLPCKRRERQKKMERMSMILPLEDEGEGGPDLQFYKARFNWDALKKQIQNELQSAYVLQGEMFEINQIQGSSLASLKKKINREEQIFYIAMKGYYVRCLKVEFIYNYILRPLDSPSIKGDRGLLELLNLIVSTCFTTISQINVKYQQCQKKSYQALLVGCIDKQTQQLYQQVLKTMKRLGDELTECENKTKSMLLDRWKKFWSQDEYKRKEIFLNGVSEFDYGEAEKIEFTMEIWEQNKKGLKGMKEMEQVELKEAVKYMRYYKKIWNISDNSDIQQNYPSLKHYIDSVLFQKEYSEVYC